MNEKDLNSIDELKMFLEGSRPIAFSICGNKHEHYKWIQCTLVKFNYLTPKKHEIRSDNGPQMTSNAMYDYVSSLDDMELIHEFIPPATPNKNAHTLK